MTNDEPAPDFTLRVYVLSYLFHSQCICHIYSNPANRCSRCDILLRAPTEWPYEYRLVFAAYNTTEQTEVSK